MKVPGKVTEGYLKEVRQWANYLTRWRVSQAMDGLVPGLWCLRNNKEARVTQVEWTMRRIAEYELEKWQGREGREYGMKTI